MAAPEYVPNTLDQQPRRGLPLPPARPWSAERTSDSREPHPRGSGFGNPGPDQGYALTLARRFEDRLHLADGEHLEDVVAACTAVAVKRASLFGRAPVIHDLEVAFTLWGYLDQSPPVALADARKALFPTAAEDYGDRRAIVDRVPAETLCLTPAQVRERYPSGWRGLLGLD